MKVVRTAMPGMPARIRAEQAADVCAARLPLHFPQHPVADVLERHVDVAGDLGHSAIVRMSSSLQCAGWV
jgi:hypothetical protein